MEKKGNRLVQVGLTGQNLFMQTRVIEEFLFAEHVEYIKAKQMASREGASDEEIRKAHELWLRARGVLHAHSELFALMKYEFESRGLSIEKLLEKYQGALSEAAIVREAILHAPENAEG